MESKPDTTSPAANTPATSRRQEVRLEPPPQLICAVTGSSAKFHVRDISIGGLALWSSMPLRRDAPHEFCLTYRGLTVIRSGRAVHCKRQNDGRWILGVSFLPDPPPGPGTTIEELIDAMSPIEFE